MCRRIHLEICCCEEALHPFPFTLRAIELLSLCQRRVKLYAPPGEDSDGSSCDYIYELQPPSIHSSSEPRSPRSRAHGCLRYDPNYVRDERIFFASCDNCVRRKAAAAVEFDNYDMRVNLEHNHLLLEELMNAARSKEYHELLRAFPAEFGIVKRYVLWGMQWHLIKSLDVMDALTLSPDPPQLLDVERVQWLLDQGMSEVCDEISNALAHDYDPVQQKIRHWLDNLPSGPKEFLDPLKLYRK
ncbi:hypothetical protein F4819DRAFT_508380 [Hypoxylon fuscum]|nr:hypothetical protein F4819DRAFT_508380 [Hypoxylon fuscum]